MLLNEYQGTSCAHILRRLDVVYQRRVGCPRSNGRNDAINIYSSYIRLSLRAGFIIFSRLCEFLDHADAQAAARGEGPEDKSIDPHFRSGVLLGSAVSSLALSFMPVRLKALADLFGYHGDRHEGLRRLYRAGGWNHESDEPEIDAGQSGNCLLASFTGSLADEADFRSRRSPTPHL
jgi:hypothetical protein